MLTSEAIERNLKAVHERVRAALERGGRGEDGVRLMAVSKTWPAEAVEAAAEAGQTLFGENRVQELQEKVPALPGHLEWHLIGHLQKNKIRKVLPLVSEIHSVDSLELARQIDRIGGEEGVHPVGYLEINLAGESTKYGFEPGTLEAQMEDLLGLSRLEIAGLMIIPPLRPELEATRRDFVALREFRDRLEAKFGVRLPGLSMGMSHDFEIAIEEGSTIVRVGSAIFGPRGG